MVTIFENILFFVWRWVFKVFQANGSLFQPSSPFVLFFLVLFTTRIFSIYVTLNYTLQDNSETLSHSKTVLMEPDTFSNIQATRTIIPKKMLQEN